MSDISFFLVDDEEQFVEAIEKRLKKRGFNVDTAFSGSEALNKLEDNDGVDVVVLDIRMPELDGMTLLEKIRKMNPLLEVIMLTGHGTVPSAIEALKAGAFDYLMKPCDLEDLISKATLAASRKRDREGRIHQIRTKPYISEKERERLISEVLES